MNILLADANVDLCEMFAIGMRHEGYTVTIAQSAEQATSAGLSEPYDCYLFDWHLPPTGGLKLLQQFRGAQEGTSHNTAVCWSASPPDALPVAPSAFDSILFKPISLARVIEAIRGQSCSICRAPFDHRRNHRACEPPAWLFGAADEPRR